MQCTLRCLPPKRATTLRIRCASTTSIAGAAMFLESCSCPPSPRYTTQTLRPVYRADHGTRRSSRISCGSASRFRATQAPEMTATSRQRSSRDSIALLSPCTRRAPESVLLAPVLRQSPGQCPSKFELLGSDPRESSLPFQESRTWNLSLTSQSLCRS